MGILVPFQMDFRQGLPEIEGNLDYRTFRENLERINQIIEFSKQDITVMEYAVRAGEFLAKGLAEKQERAFSKLGKKKKSKIQKMARRALRFGIARHLTGESLRDFSCRLADSPVLQRFCLIDRTGIIRVPSKSSLERYEKWVPEEAIRKVVCEINKKAWTPAPENGTQVLGLKDPIQNDDYYLDLTCLKTNIHFPVDWVLLRDATRTLMKAVKLIRENGLKHRMEEPATFLKNMNKLSIQMTHTRKKKDGRKKRKKVFRSMKRLLKKAEGHAKRHRLLLLERWPETALSEGEVRQIVKRLDNVLEQLPLAVWQAHERVIGGRLVPNSKKILSLYERDTNVLVRGKAGAEVEFGNFLMLGEQQNGVILDWKLYQKQVSDTKSLPESIERMKELYDGYKPSSISTDRGCSSENNSLLLGNEEIKDYTCPRSVEALRVRLCEEDFCEHQTRRAQTEARIGILKNSFLGRPLRSKGFVHRDLSVAWGVLAHNLWVLARLPRVESLEAAA